MLAGPMSNDEQIPFWILGSVMTIATEWGLLGLFPVT